MPTVKRKPRPPPEWVKEPPGPQFAWRSHPFDSSDRPPHWQRIGPYIVPIRSDVDR